MTAEKSLFENLKKIFKLPDDAIAWLLMLWGIIQVFDDVADGDVVDRKNLDSVIWNSLVAINQNSFFVANANILTPCLALAVMKWQTSDIIERAGEAGAKSYMWRAGFYDVILMVVQICHGTEFAIQNGKLVLELYGENLDDYLLEMKNA